MNADKHLVFISVDRRSSAAASISRLANYMSKSSLRVLAVLLTLGIIGVLFAGLDDLPRDVRAQIAAERTAYAAAQSQLKAAQDEVARDAASEAALFSALPSAREYPDRLSRAPARWRRRGVI